MVFGVVPSLSSFILFGGVEIAEKLQEDKTFVKELVKNLTADATKSATGQADASAQEGYLDHVGLLKEYCNLGKTLLMEPKNMLFKTLVSLGLFEILGAWLRGSQIALIEDAVELLLHYLASHTDTVRQAILDKYKANQALLKSKPPKPTTPTLLQDLVHCFNTVQSKGLLMQIFGMIRRLLNSEDMDVTKQVDKSKLLTIFYDDCMDGITAALDADPVPPLAKNCVQHERLVHVLELLTFAVPLHTYHIKNYLMSPRRMLVAKVNKVIASPHMVLKLAALRLLRCIVGLKNEFYNRHLIKVGIFQPAVEGLVKNGPRNNLLFSCTLEILEYIRKENISSLVAHVAETQEEALKSYTFAKTPQDLLARYLQNKEATEARSAEAAADASNKAGSADKSNRFRRDTTMDQEEESYWDDNDDDEGSHDVPLPATMATEPANAATGPEKTAPGPGNAALGGSTATSGGSADSDSSRSTTPIAASADATVTTAATTTTTAAVTAKRPPKRLVDYDDDEDGVFPQLGALAKRAKKFPMSLAKGQKNTSFKFSFGAASTDATAAHKDDAPEKKAPATYASVAAMQTKPADNKA